MIEANDEARLAKLPVWARNEIKRLRRDLADLRQSSSTFFGGVASPVRLRGYPTYDGETYLPSHGAVRFSFGRSAIEVRIDEEELYVMGTGPTARLSVRPQSSNVVRIAMADA